MPDIEIRNDYRLLLPIVILILGVFAVYIGVTRDNKQQTNPTPTQTVSR